MAIEYFCCYHSYRKKCEKLSDQELGRLFRALMTFSETGERADLAGRESIAFDFIADDITRAKEAYAEKCRKNAANGSAGAEKRWGKNGENSERHFEDGENGQNKYKDKSKGKKDIVTLTGYLSTRTDYNEAVEAYNTLCAPTLPAVKQLSKARQGHLKTGFERLQKAGLTWTDYFTLAAQSDFLMGRNGAWHGCGFDWLIKPANMLKVIEGNYNNQTPAETDEAERKRQADLRAWRIELGEVEPDEQ